MSNIDLAEWMDKYSSKGWYWYVKKLAGNDTLANDTHQAGPYVPKIVMAKLAPSVLLSRQHNPRHAFYAIIDSHELAKDVVAIWYNGRVLGIDTRDECRMTRWGGRSSPVLNPESTGSTVIFAFHPEEDKNADEVHIWLCTGLEEENTVEDRIGPIEPGTGIFITHTDETADTQVLQSTPARCSLALQDIPSEWLRTFPSGVEIVEKSIAFRPMKGKLPDARLMERKACEYEIFRSIEEQYVLPRVTKGFESVEAFLELANSVANRRKSRAGKSLELQAKVIFDEEGIAYSHGEISELNKRPDFLFPSAEVYRNSTSSDSLFMLGVKTTCKDRWRQVINEADKIKVKYLLTVQEGVSENQFREMQDYNVILVVPEQIHGLYPPSVREDLLSFREFIQKVREVS